MIKLVISFLISGIVAAGIVWLAKASSRVPIVYVPEKYEYYPEDKEKLSLKETIYYMRDKLLLKLFYGLFVFFWIVVLIILVVTSIVYKELTTAGELIGASICMIVSFGLITGIFVLILYATKQGEQTVLIRNTSEYIGLAEERICDLLEADLAKGMRFRSKGLILTEQYILGTVSQWGLSPVAIPVEQVKGISYDVKRYTNLSGPDWWIVNFFLDLQNGKKVVLYINYVNWEIVVQMFKYHGFNIQ